MKLGKEVKFQVGESIKYHGKLADYRVRSLAAGKIKWEIVEDDNRRRGHVVKVANEEKRSCCPRPCPI